MANIGICDKWYFTKEQLENTPSRKCGYDAHKELSYRQQAANFIQDMGQRLKVSQLCINTAIVYMHRFYVFHSFTNFPWYQMAAAALFLAAKVEEQPRKLEYVIRVANICRNSNYTNIDINSERYIAQSQDLVFNENVLLQTLGFDVAIDHPHTHVVRCCHLVRASKDLAQTSYFMASNSLHLTTMCIQYKPTVVACFCILVACKWSNWEIPLSNEKKEWYSYVDPTVTADLLQQLTEEFLVIFEACPSRLKEKIMAIADNVSHTPNLTTNSPFDTEPKKKEDVKDSHYRSSHEIKSGSENDPHKHRSSRPHDAGSSSQQQRERDKHRERLVSQQKVLINSQVKAPHGHQRPPIDPKMKQHTRPPYPPPNRVEPRDILREAARDSPFGLANKDTNSRDSQLVRSSDNKRDYLLKPNVQTDMNSLNNYPHSEQQRLSYDKQQQQRVDPNRSRIDPSKVKPYLKTETENIKKHLSASVLDKNTTFLNKSLVPPSSQKMKSPFDIETSKSVPKHSQGQASLQPKLLEGTNGSLFSPPSTIIDSKSKPELASIREDLPTTVTKRPSLFSPEKSPPQKKTYKSPRGKNEPMVSPLTSPEESKRTRNYSSSSEPELRPVIPKIDKVEGFETLMRDNTIGIDKIGNISDVIVQQELKLDAKPEPTLIETPKLRPTETTAVSNTLVNGMETNTIVISNLLKEASALPHRPTIVVSESTQVLAPPPEIKVEKEHHHHKSKKKNKEKHKHKDKSREDREKKKKHKDKDREKSKHKEKQVEATTSAMPAEPIKLKIQKDKIQLVPESSSCPSQGLKIKIPKDKIKTESLSELSHTLTPPPPPPPPGGGIKLKIPKEKINNCSLPSLDSGGSSRKRERERTSPTETIPAKLPKSSGKDSKQNGRHSYNKVTQMGDGDTSLHRLAESKYTHKSSSS